MTWQRSIASVVPFYYGYIVLCCAMCSSFARQAAAVSTLSVFIVPMTLELDWTRSEISGAVSLGGIMAAVISPWLGRLVDRHGARVVLTLSSVCIAATAFALAATHSLLWFYVMFSVGRLIFASPFDLGISSAVANWFVRFRARAMSGVSLTTGFSLAIVPFIAQLGINAGGWRSAWVLVAVMVLVVGAIPNGLFMARRPEDLGLAPDGAPASTHPTRVMRTVSSSSEASWTLAQARRTRAFWLLMCYSGLIFSVQAGVSLHQAPHMIQRGIDATVAASIVSTFALVAALSGLLFGFIGSRWPVRYGLAVAALVMALGALVMSEVDSVFDGYLSAIVFGIGIGGILTLVPVSFADYFGRTHYGAIRGFTLPVQIIGQALGPLVAGQLFDVSGDYQRALQSFCACAVIAAVMVMLAQSPRRLTLQ